MDGKGHSDEVLGQMSNMLLGSGRKVILVVRCQKTFLNCVYILLFCGRQSFVSNKIGYLPKHTVQSVVDKS